MHIQSLNKFNCGEKSKEVGLEHKRHNILFQPLNSTPSAPSPDLALSPALPPDLPPSPALSPALAPAPAPFPPFCCQVALVSQQVPVTQLENGMLGLLLLRLQKSFLPRGYFLFRDLPENCCPQS